MENFHLTQPSPTFSLKTEGAKGLKLSLYLTFKFKIFCILSEVGSPKIDLPPKALGQIPFFLETNQ